MRQMFPLQDRSAIEGSAASGQAPMPTSLGLSGIADLIARRQQGARAPIGRVNAPGQLSSQPWFGFPGGRQGWLDWRAQGGVNNPNWQPGQRGLDSLGPRIGLETPPNGQRQIRPPQPWQPVPGQAPQPGQPPQPGFQVQPMPAPIGVPGQPPVATPVQAPTRAPGPISFEQGRNLMQPPQRTQRPTPTPSAGVARRPAPTPGQRFFR